jgi:hypothetical protein
MKNDFDIHQWQAKYLKEETSNKQTAVEYLQSQISYRENGVDMYEDFFNKAKQIEKKQIQKAFSDGAEWELYGSDIPADERAESYYNQNY